VLLNKAKVNMSVYEHVLEFALNGYASMGREAVTDYLLNYPQLAEGEITMEEGLRLDSITEPYQKVRVGAKVPDFKGITIDGKAYCLYDSNAPHVIIVFWSTDCEYCHDFLVQIRKHLNLKSDFELVTFALAEDKDDVVKSAKKMRLPGYHFYDDLRWDSKAFLDYHITSTPTVFVLDENKTIVCKPYDWQELKDWLKSNNISY
jgi:peroxiredoxin